MDSFAFVQTIEAELKRKNIKKADFYRATGISSATFSQWRNRIYSPSSANIKSVENFLDIKVEAKAKKPTPDGELTGIRAEAWELIKSMSDEQLKTFIVTYKALAE